MKKRILIYPIILLILLSFAAADSVTVTSAEDATTLYIFHSSTCPHCEDELKFLDSIKDDYPDLIVKDFEISTEENSALFMEVMQLSKIPPPYGVPVTFIGDEYFVGYGSDETTGKDIEAEIQNCLEDGCVDAIDRLRNNGANQTSDDSLGIIDLPFGFQIDTSKVGLPLFTIVLAGLDGINPCAIWVLCFLLTLMVYAESRKKMLLIGSIFVLTSGIIYFIFMAAWLNLFLVVGYVNILRIIVASIAVIIGLVNMKDYFFFKKGLSFTLPDKFKPKLFKKMRMLVRENAIRAIVFGTVVLAVMANTFELICTFGLPAVYTRALTLQNLPMVTYYSYLVLYNIIYVIPLAVIVGIFVATMGAHKFTEKQGRILKLISGVLMLVLGLILLLKPGLLAF